MGLFVDFMLVAGIVMTLIILFLLFRMPAKELPQKILIAFFIYLLLVTLSYYSDLHDLGIITVLTFIFQDHIELVIGPLLLLYVKSLFEKDLQFLKRSWRHFIPAILYTFLISIPILASIIQGAFVFSYLETLSKYELLVLEFQSLFLVAYIILALRIVKRYSKALKDNYSNLKEIDIGWVKKLLWGVLVVVIIDLCINSYEIATTEMEWDTGFITMVFLVILLYYLGYYGTSQSKILLPDFLLKIDDGPIVKDQSDASERIASHHLASTSPEKIEELRSRLSKVLEVEKPYLDEDLTLGVLANKVSTTDKKLSALLNHYMNISFYDLINKHRVQEVKTKMSDENFDNFTLLALAYDSGFKSKTSFNRIFKKMTGSSPSEYKKQHS